MRKNPKAAQFNPTSGKRLYAGGSGGYIARMRQLPDRTLEYALQQYKVFMAHSVFKKPYLSTQYNTMEYMATPLTVPPPIRGVIPGVPPPPHPGPGPAPVPAPGPTPTPVPPPWWSAIYFCDIPSFFFCPGGPAVMVPVVTNDGIANAEAHGDGSASSGGNSVIFTPGGSQFSSITVTTNHGSQCYGMGHAKDPAECLADCGTPSIGYTTAVMGFTESQTFSVVGGAAGRYTWSVAGGGTINANTGAYISPPSNADCTLKPVVSLLCGGNVMAALTLTITATSYNACTTALIGFHYLDLTYNPPNGFCCSLYYNCSGNAILSSCPGKTSSLYCVSDYPAYAVRADFPPCTAYVPPSDQRTTDMKTAGCCPPQLM